MIEEVTLDSEVLPIEFSDHPDNSAYVVMKTVVPVAWLNAIIRKEDRTLLFSGEEILPALDRYKKGM
ncbi:MAG: hypothetical protein LAN36_11580 [Acidobacteriia bacterium]|nr:hypothetical protein [Terriglobia bacterium]